MLGLAQIFINTLGQRQDFARNIWGRDAKSTVVLTLIYEGYVIKMGMIRVNHSLIYSDLRQRAQRIHSVSLPLSAGGSDVSILRPSKRRLLISLSLHHPHNRLENISIFYLPLFNQVAKKKYP
jgi:hypothetical protein